MKTVTKKQWQHFKDEGWLKLDERLSEKDLKALQDEIDAIMLGQADLDYDRIMMQLDSSTGKYNNMGEQTIGHKGSTLNYRKIEKLEFDPVFLTYAQHPIFKDFCDRLYGPDTPITSFRCMFMNKPANRGTWLPWHQDRWNYLDRDPILTVWTALDPATIENGCVQIIPGSHKFGLINPAHPSGFLTKAQGEKFCPDEKRVYLELEAGEVALLHNHLLHASDVNRSNQSRRAFSVCYMDGATNDTKNATPYARIFGPNALTVENLKAARGPVSKRIADKP